MRSSLEELSVALVGDAKMRDLHQRFMGIAEPTDVLTFPLETDGRGRCVSGEVVVCVSEARRQAKERGIRVEHEMLLYAVHGMLHLSGLDDRTQADYRMMHGTEDRILTALGVGAVFYADRRQDAAARRRRRPAQRSKKEQRSVRGTR